MPKIKKVVSALRRAGYAGIEASEWRSSVRLEGELDSWNGVVSAGMIAAHFGYKGVINDITLRGFEHPPMSVPAAQDKSLEGARPDVLVIGGGVIGCAILRELSKLELSLLLIDKESDVAMQTSSRNDGMIHPGIASNPKKKSAMYNVRGNAMYTPLCRELHVPFERYGSLVLFENRLAGMAGSLYLGARARKLGIEGLFANRKRLLELEPNLSEAAACGCEYPSAGVLSPYKLTVALAEHAVQNGAKISLETVATGFEMIAGRISGVKTNRGTIRPRVIINAAGVFSDKIAAMANDGFFTIHPRKGETAILDKNVGGLVLRSMGVVSLSAAHSNTKGGGVMRTIDGNVLIGPDAFEQPLREDFSTTAGRLDAVLSKHLPLIKGLSRRDVITYYAGIRAATYEEDFIVEPSEYVGNLIHAAGIQSPGLASAPAIAEDIAKMAIEKLKNEIEVKPRRAYKPERVFPPVMAQLSIAEKQKLIEKNPDYGVVVCRCEQITAGEIKAQLNAPVPALTVDALKRRVRTGMGRCQGGFCTPTIIKLISEKTGDSTAITKSGAGSEMVVGRTRKGAEK